MTTLPGLTARERHHLARTLTAIAAAEAGPPPEDLAAAPTLDLWRPLATLDLTPVLWGHVRSHPRLAPGPAVTSRLIALNRPDGWARTLSRWYRLAESFSEFEVAPARKAGVSGKRMRVLSFELGGYLPVDDPAVLDRLLAAYIARVRAFAPEEWKHR